MVEDESKTSTYVWVESWMKHVSNFYEDNVIVH